MNYRITGTIGRETEELESEVESLKEALRIASEYRLAFGNKWIIKVYNSNGHLEK